MKYLRELRLFLPHQKWYPVMDGNQVFILGLGLQFPWKLVDQHLDTSTKPSVLTLNVAADRGSLYPCPAPVVAKPVLHMIYQCPYGRVEQLVPSRQSKS